MSKPARKAPVCRSIIHEVNLNGQHRIVIVTDGMPECSEWFEYHTIGSYKGLCCCALGNSAIPIGIFRVTMVASQGLAS